MSISERYRDLTLEVMTFRDSLSQGTEEESKELRNIKEAAGGLAELQEAVGEIPRMKLEYQLTPVLLKAHSRLDRARLILEEQGAEDRAAAVWDLEQKIYRLLNDL